MHVNPVNHFNHLNNLNHLNHLNHVNLVNHVNHVIDPITLFYHFTKKFYTFFSQHIFKPFGAKISLAKLLFTCYIIHLPVGSIPINVPEKRTSRAHEKSDKRNTIAVTHINFSPCPNNSQ